MDPMKFIERTDCQAKSRDAQAEEILIQIWKEVLHLKQVGIHSNFFSLGGDSILALQVCAKVYEEGFDLQPETIFEHPTIFELAKGLEKHPAESPQKDLLQGSEEELDYWLSVVTQPFEPLFAKKSDPPEIAKKVSASWTREETESLENEIPRVYHNVRLADIFLAALFQTFTTWTGRPQFLFEIHLYGREALSEKTPFLPTRFPLLLKSQQSLGISDLVPQVKDQMRLIPREGIGYGLLYDLSQHEKAKALRAAPATEVAFHFLEKSQNAAEMVAAFQAHLAAQSQKPDHSLSIFVWLANGCYQTDWIFPIHGMDKIEYLLNSFVHNIRLILQHGQSLKKKIYTPSDFPEAGLNAKELDKLLSEITE